MSTSQVEKLLRDAERRLYRVGLILVLLTPVVAALGDKSGSYAFLGAALTLLALSLCVPSAVVAE